jgi:ribose transport system ATP-binding protein
VKEKVIESVKINKEFPGVKALSDFDFKLFKNEVHCLIGENGAGKSTFIKILSGVYKPNSGEIIINGDSYSFLSTHLVRNLGIQTVYQEDVLVPHISAAENIFLGSKYQKRKIFVSYKKIIQKSQVLAEQLGIDLNVRKLYENLSPSDQQFIKILKALAQKPQVLILDEPTQVFNVQDTELIIRIVKKIKKGGVGVIYIAHDLDEVIKVADRITVLRDGMKINTHDKSVHNLDPGILAKEMVGRPVNLFYTKKKHAIGEPVFEVKGLKLDPSFKEINFDVKKGEILGIAGLKGSGRTEVARAIFGALNRYDGRVMYDGKDVTPKSPIDAVKNGIAMLTEDKKIDGLFMGMPVYQNITIVGLSRISRFFINMRKEKRFANDFIERMNIKTASMDQEVQFLSGGNQQKVVIAKWLFQGVNILIVDEPTHGIDVNAKVEVYELFTELTSSGKSIIMISSEMPEIISISDRVIVMRNFEISKILTGEEITEANILSGYLGGSRK